MRATRRAIGLAPLLAIGLAGTARAHDGNLPLAAGVFRWRGALVVPSPFYGAFVRPAGTPPGGAWKLICSESINTAPARQWAQGGDGTFYVTGYHGVSASRDGGCSFRDADGELGRRPASAVIADPTDPRGAFATTNASIAEPWNAIFRTGDGGRTWAPLLRVEAALHGVAIARDGGTIWAVGAPRVIAVGTPPLALWVSRDRGARFDVAPVSLLLDGNPPETLKLLALDPADPSRALCAASAGRVRALVEIEAWGARARERFRSDAAINGVMFDPDGGALVVYTAAGVVREEPGGRFAPLPAFGPTPCLRPDDDAPDGGAPDGGARSTIFACAFHVDPAEPALLAAPSLDGAFAPVLRFTDVDGVLACPPGTPVAELCPPLWSSYDYHFVPLVDAGVPDAAGGDLASAAPPRAAACSLARGRDPGPNGAALGLLLALALRLRTRRISAASPAGRA